MLPTMTQQIAQAVRTACVTKLAMQYHRIDIATKSFMCSCFFWWSFTTGLMLTLIRGLVQSSVTGTLSGCLCPVCRPCRVHTYNLTLWIGPTASGITWSFKRLLGCLHSGKTYIKKYRTAEALLITNNSKSTVWIIEIVLCFMQVRNSTSAPLTLLQCSSAVDTASFIPQLLLFPLPLLQVHCNHYYWRS